MATKTHPIGSTLYEWRLRADISAKAVAEELGWQASKLSRLENGRQRPGVGDIKALAEFYGEVDDGYVERHDGPHWFLHIHGYDDENKEREERHEVTQTLHDMVQVGQTVNLSDQSIVPK